jgi:hypothetical protein
MYVRRLVIENIRGFRQLDFGFERPKGVFAGWTVITGDNASGKTAFLKCLASALVGPEILRILQPSLRGWVRQNCAAGTIAAQLTVGEKDSFAKGRPYEKVFWSELELTEMDSAEVSLGQGKKYKGKGRGPTNGPWTDSPKGWFSSGYGPFRRLYGSSTEAQRVMVGPSRAARYVTMFREDATLGECEIWLKELKHKELEGGVCEKELLRKVLALINDGLLPSGIRADKVDSDGLWLRQPNNVVLPLTEISDGFRAVLALVVDIVRHLAEVYGQEELLEEGSSPLCVPLPGVILIDEIDSHLHPEWQRRIGFWLKERFPSIQFLVTTHSPLICQAADPGGLFHLPSPGSEHCPFQLKEDDYLHVIMSPPDEIYISPAFSLTQIHSPGAMEKRYRHAQLRAKVNAGVASPEDKKELAQLNLFTDEGAGVS